MASLASVHLVHLLPVIAYTRTRAHVLGPNRTMVDKVDNFTSSAMPHRSIDDGLPNVGPSLLHRSAGGAERDRSLASIFLELSK